MSWQAINETLSQFCSSPFWDSNLTWNSPDPDFTTCFEKTILVWIPCLFLWLFLPLEIHNLRQTKAFYIPFKPYNITKLVLIAAMTLMVSADIIYGVLLDENFASIDLYSASIKFSTLFLFFVLTYANIQCGVRSSGILFMFSFLLALLGAPQFRSVFRPRCNVFTSCASTVGSRSECIEYLFFYPMVLAVLLLNCFTDAPPTVRTFLGDRNVCPENQSSLPSRIFFAWYDAFAWRGYKRPVKDEHLWSLEDDLRSEVIIHKFESEWYSAFKRANKKKCTDARKSTEAADNSFVRSSVSVFRPLCGAFGPRFLWGIVLSTAADCLTFVSPLILKAVIAFVDNKSEYRWHSYVYAVAFFVVATLETLLSVHYYHLITRIGLQIRTALVSAIYKKALKISSGARKRFTAGDVVNLMAVDVQRFVDLMSVINSLWSAPLQICLALYFLWITLGPSVLAGLAVIMLLVPVLTLIAFKMKNLQIVQMKNKDKRVRLMQEILSTIKVLKLYAWESSFEERVVRIRDREMKMLKTEAFLTSINAFVWACAPFLISSISFAMYVMSSDTNVLDAQTAFVSLSIFNILRTPLSTLPFLIKNIAQTFVSMQRINEFLNTEELDPSAVSHEIRHEPIIVENGNFSWDGYDAPPVLNNINLRVKPGSLIAVVGPVGAGKSSLFAAILGEMYKQSGFVNTRGSVAYVPQQAWIQNATLKDNITMGRTFRTPFYEEVLRACALTADLRTLPARDETEVGEKGTNLSGGQKQRISLARAVLSDADIYLLDDPLSAVDSGVGKHIFGGVIGPNGLLRKKTRVMATHCISHLTQVDFIVVLEKGVILEAGTYAELIQKRGDFAQFLATDAKKNDEFGKVAGIHPGRNIVRQRSRINSGRAARQSLTRQTSTGYGSDEDDLDAIGQDLAEAAERTESGNIRWKVWTYYFHVIGPVLTGLTISTNILSTVFLMASKYWLSVWTSDSAATADRNLGTNYLSVYGFLGSCQVIALVLMTLSLSLGVLRAAKRLHNDLLEKLMRWPLHVFERTPIGRILNRFNRDLDVLDEEMPDSLWNLMYLGSELVCILGIISYTIPMFTVVILPIGINYFIVQRIFMSSSRQLKRLESVSRSPIYSHFGATVSGAQSIRAYGLQKKFIRACESKIDHNNESYYANLVSNRWISMRLEMMGNFLIFFSSLLATQSKDTLSSGLIGLSLSYALEITDTLNWLFIAISEVETNIVAVERFVEYGEIELEAPWQLPTDKRVSDDWPERGDVQFDEFQTRYQEGLELVLRGVTFRVKGGHKVGIVGRTGAGKSSLTLSLFRIIESCAGKIMIDDVDISKIGLHTLRKRLTIIPQDPMLFSGTLRMNLDPTEEHSDEKLWRALELADLKSYVSTLNFGLNCEVSEGGDNFSVGRRQLICLARALLRKTKVLILDEATAAIDTETDTVIQATIRSEFRDCTVLTIAHRLNTIVDYDRIIVLDEGRVVEFGSPASLLVSERSVFHKMVEDALA